MDLLQIATGITKCDGFITNCDRYYKVQWLLQIATVPHASTLDAKLSIHLIVNWYNTTMFWALKSCRPKILHRRNYGDKKGNKSFQKQRCSAGNLDDLLWKYCKSRYAELSCSDVHWNFWRMCNVKKGIEVCNWYQLAISPARVLLSVCSLHFTLSLNFTHLPQSAFYTDRLKNIGVVSEKLSVWKHLNIKPFL